jgi:acetylornithine deacetylase/succinyl-diaminopimelate desuccinylase-like protein
MAVERRGRIEVPAVVIDADEIVALALTLLSTPSPAGAEAPLARELASWLRARTSVDVTVQPVDDGALAGGRPGPGSANLLVGPSEGAEIALYGHLDTSLAGDPLLDGLLVSRPDRVPAPRMVDGVLWGHGAAVAKAPLAAAMVALVALHRSLGADAPRVGALVAAGGTHRALPPWPSRADGGRDRPMGSGVRAAIASGFVPGAVIVGKGGAPGVLHEEPGMVYLAVTLRDRYRPALAEPESAVWRGPAADVASVVAAIERWRVHYIASTVDDDAQVVGDVALGAIAVGAPSKPDVHADHARVHLHVTTVPDGHDPEAIVRAVAAALRDDAELVARGMADRVEVVAYGDLAAGRTRRDHPLVGTTRDAWHDTFGTEAPTVRRWRGTTDGALLRALGIPTVRVGPPLLTNPDDPRVEGVRVDDLVDFARLWATTVLRTLRPAASGAEVTDRG